MNGISTTSLEGQYFNATSNPNLNCIEVDDVTAAETNWTNIDATASFSLDCGNTLALIDSELEQSISIYPSPAASEIHITTDENITSIDVIDALGNTIKSKVPSHSVVDVSDLSNGVYFLQIVTERGAISKKFVKD